MTMTLNFDVAVLPFASVAVQVTAVVPIGNFEPDGGVQTSERTGVLESEALASYSTIAPSGLVAAARIGVGDAPTLIVGPTLLYSNAPMSQASPDMPGRAAPRWSTVVQVAESPAPIAGLVASSAWSGVAPP
jgi:hypothetical protein